MITPQVVILSRLNEHRNTPEQLQMVADEAGSQFKAGKSDRDYWLAAWLSAAYAFPLDLSETVELTRAMAASGSTLDLSSLGSRVVDKHSTGGVGDKTTIILLPLLAACGVCCAKMSGKGLGHTGGTIDKLDSVPGFNTKLTPNQMVEQCERIGLCLAGQSADLAPADGKLYQLRDATGTVASIPLICASILSKKAAGGAKIIGLDVKCGSGAMMDNVNDAHKLAEWLVKVGEALGLHVHAMVTDMTQPLGRAVGNALEVKEAAAVLRGQSKGRLRDLCVTLAAQTLASLDDTDAMAVVEKALADGSAFAKAKEWFAAQGADPAVLENDHWCEAKHQTALTARQTGHVSKMDARTVGEVSVTLGAGRIHPGDKINPAVGIEVCKEVGQEVSAGENLFVIHHDEPIGAEISDALYQAVDYSHDPVMTPKLILQCLD